MWRHLSETKLSGCHYRLITLITGLDDPVRGTHANREEARTNHEGVQMLCAGVIGKVIQSERDWVFKICRFSIRVEQGVVQTLEENLKPPCCFLGDQPAAWETIQGLAIAGASDLLSISIWEGASGQRWGVWDLVSEVQLSP